MGLAFGSDHVIDRHYEGAQKEVCWRTVSVALQPSRESRQERRRHSVLLGRMRRSSASNQTSVEKLDANAIKASKAIPNVKNMGRGKGRNRLR
jgi:hypothetical protein